MNKFFRSTLLTSMLAVGLAACGDDVTVVDPPPPPPPPAPAVHSITVGPDGGSVTVGATLTMVAAVNADAGVATTVTWSSSDNAKATVSAAGVVTGVAAGSVGIKACSTVNTSVCGVATVAVTAAPVATVTAVVITPPAATLVIGQSITASANVQGTNSPSQAVTWSSLAPAVASVDAGGVVTAIANGTAVIKATSNANSSIAGTMSVTVFTPQPATISIQSITSGNLNTAVKIDSVSGQIEITLNVDNGAYTITKAQALVNGTTVVAEQVFASGSAANAAPGNVPSTIVLSLNTRQVEKLANGAYVPVIFNGPNSITARIFVGGQTNPISSNAVPVVMQNRDAITAGTTPSLTPLSNSPSFISSGPPSIYWYKSDVVWTGGPNYISFFPVTPTISATSASCGSSASNQTGTPQTGFTLGGQLACLTAPAFEGGVSITGFTVTPGTAPAADVKYLAAGAPEQVGTAYTVAGSTRYNLLAGGTLALGNTVYIDTKGPTIAANEIGFLAGCSTTIPNPGCWIGTAYNIQNDFTSTDAGTGVNLQTITNFLGLDSFGNAICGVTPFSAALLAEDPSPVKYDACATATDNIGNVSGTIRGANLFGVDKTNPTIAYAGTYVSDSTVKTTVGAGTIDYSVNDNNAGLDAAAVTLNLATLIADAAPACTSGNLGVLIAPAGAGVARTLAAPIASADNSCGDQGYYVWTASVTDRAGNTTNATSPIVAAVDRTAPAIQAVAPQPLYMAGSPATLLVFATDSTDLAGVRLDVRYRGTGGTDVDLRYKITSGFGTVWDNVLTTITTPSTGFPAIIPGNQVFGSFVIDTTVSLGGPDSAFTQVQTTAFDFNTIVPNLSATVLTPIPSVYKNNAFFPAVGAANPWATTGIQAGATFSGSGACTYTYDTPTNGPTIPVQVLVANQVSVGPPLLLEILFAITTTGNGLGATDNPRLLSDNGTFRRYQYSVSASTCAVVQGTGTLRLIAVKNDTAGLPSAYLVP